MAKMTLEKNFEGNFLWQGTVLTSMRSNPSKAITEIMKEKMKVGFCLAAFVLLHLIFFSLHVHMFQLKTVLALFQLFCVSRG